MREPEVKFYKVPNNQTLKIKGLQNLFACVLIITKFSGLSIKASSGEIFSIWVVGKRIHSDPILKKAIRNFNSATSVFFFFGKKLNRASKILSLKTRKEQKPWGKICKKCV